MKEKLKTLFDYQKFEQNERLARIIGEAEKDSETKRTELSESEIFTVFAAGEDGDVTPQKSGLFPENIEGDDNTIP